jgi:uncharacterized protein (TIGR03435 family)
MKIITLFIALTSLTLAQASNPEKKAAFEVVSIHRADDDGNHSNRTNAGFYRTHNSSLKRLIARAYGINLSQIYGGPSWVDSDSYDITAKIPGDGPQSSDDKVAQMTQSLLADRFHLVIHREPRQVSGYALVLAKKGAQNKESKMERANLDQQGSRMNANNTHITAENLTMEAFAKDLSRMSDIGELVVDQTGLKGGFNFTLDWMPERPDSKPDASPDDRPSLFTAVEEQLGLKLERAKVPVQGIVIDRAEKPEFD